MSFVTSGNQPTNAFRANGIQGVFSRPEGHMKRRIVGLILSALGVGCIIVSFILLSHALFALIALFKM